MHTAVKIWLIVAAALVVLGSIAFCFIMTSIGWDWRKLDTSSFLTNTHEIAETFDSISVDADTADVVFLPSDGEGVKVVCFEREKELHDVSVEDGVLKIHANDTRKWYDHISIVSFNSPKLTVYLPEGMMTSLLVKTDTGDVELSREFSFDSIDIGTSTGDVRCYASVEGLAKLHTHTGHIRLEEVTVGALDLAVSTGSVRVFSGVCREDVKISTSTGDVRLKNLTCQGLEASGSTGDIHMESVIATEKMSVTTGTGEIEFEKCDAAEIFMKTSTGDIEGTLLSEKVFIYDCGTGDVDLPHTTGGGKCELITGTGDIEIRIAKQ